MTHLPDSLNRFQAELEGAIARDLGHRHRRSRVVRPLVVAAGLAAAGIAAALVAAGGGPSIVDRAEAALTLDSGSILHMKLDGRQTNPKDGSVTRWEDESWELSGANARRQIEVNAGGRVESALTADGLAQIYDPTTNTIYSENAAEAKTKRTPDGNPGKPVPKQAQAPSASKQQLPPKAQNLGADVEQPRTPAEKLRLLLQGGKLREDGHESIDGRDAIRLVSDTADLAYLVDADTFAPIEWTSRRAGGTVTLRFHVYETLPANPENEALVSLTAQHPGAAVDSDSAHYDAVQSRLFPAG